MIGLWLTKLAWKPVLKWKLRWVNFRPKRKLMTWNKNTQVLALDFGKMTGTNKPAKHLRIPVGWSFLRNISGQWLIRKTISQTQPSFAEESYLNQCYSESRRSMSTMARAWVLEPERPSLESWPFHLSTVCSCARRPNLPHFWFSSTIKQG